MYKEYYLRCLKNFQTKKILYRYGNDEYSYCSLFNYVKKITYFLENQKKKKIIITYSNKSKEMYASLFPILLSGCIWVPISINTSLSRIEQIIDSIEPDLFFFDHENEKVLNLVRRKKIKKYNLNYFYKLKERKVNLVKKIKNINFNNTAFIYFTSGSSGTPKGVKVAHKNIISDIFLQKKHLYKYGNKNLVYGDYYEPSFSYFFDIYFPAIYFGSTISPALTKADSYLIYEHYKINNINTLLLVPSSIERIKEILIKNKILLTGKYLMCAGEPFFLNLLKFIYSNTNYEKIYNCYGGTEMGNWVFHHECKKKDLISFKKMNLVPIGKVFSKTQYFIKNKELIVKGPMITNGYLLNNQNKEKFIFSRKGNNTFFTGDKAVKFKNKVFIIGRKDKMVKINGYRIEIGDVEFVTKKIKYVNEVAVFEKKLKNYKNYLNMVVFLSNKKHQSIFRADLKKKISSYMMPRKIYYGNKIPLNINGKFDRKKVIKNFS